MRAHTSARIALKEIELKVCSTKSLDAAMQLKKILKVSKNRNDFMKTSFLPKTNEINVRISALSHKAIQ